MAITLDVMYSPADKFTQEQIKQMQKKAVESFQLLKDRTGQGNDFLGWIDLPENIDDDELEQIKSVARELAKKSEVFVVAGIGGSYLGARMVIEALKDYFDSFDNQRQHPVIIYAGNTLSEDYTADLIKLLDNKDYSLCVISKSGTTTETAVCFRILRNHLEKKYGHKEALSRIVAVTDKQRGVLKSIADKEGYKTFVIPDDIGGRYSVLTPVGLLPVAVAGFDICKLVQGARDMRRRLFNDTNAKTNIALQYAVARNLLYSGGKTIELLVNYRPDLVYLSEWFKQLFGESEGKEGKGIFPASVSNTTDLHSMGQYIQEGARLMFETVLHVEKAGRTIQIPFQENDDDKLNYLQKYSLTEINHKAEQGTAMAHAEGGVSQIKISADCINEYSLGELIYFFCLTCGISGYMSDINPFNQPGVENYKSKMFKLLGKQ